MQKVAHHACWCGTPLKGEEKLWFSVVIMVFVVMIPMLVMIMMPAPMPMPLVVVYPEAARSGPGNAEDGQRQQRSLQRPAKDTRSSHAAVI